LKINIVIYESSSFGGCYKYATELFKAYRESPETGNVELLLPANAKDEGSGIHKILISDTRNGKKLHFLWRHFVNPLLLFFYLRKQPKSFVLLNDFEQLSAPLWAPFYLAFLQKHIFGVFLHDADRDAYPPSRAVSAFCMKQIMKTVSIALYHGSLPERSYYKKRKGLKYLEVEHGPYFLPEPDADFFRMLKDKTQDFKKVLVIPGNIRAEKNYDLVIEALSEFPEYCLVIAGRASNSRVEINKYKEVAERSGVEKRLIWVEKFLSDSELSAVISISDLVVLYYSASFHSQSGILHQVIPLKKPVLVSDLPNALTDTVRNYGIGIVCKADSAEALGQGLSLFEKEKIDPDWDRCLGEMSWERQVGVVMEKIHHLRGSFESRGPSSLKLRRPKCFL